MAGGAQDAEDLLQDVFLQAFRKLDSFRGDSSLGTWLYRLAVNQCLDFLRGRQARMARSTDSFEDDTVPEPSSPDVIPVVWLPWESSSQGDIKLNPQTLPLPSMSEWIESCQL